MFDDPEDDAGTDPLLDPEGVSSLELLPRGVLDVLVEEDSVGDDPYDEELVGDSPLVKLP